MPSFNFSKRIQDLLNDNDRTQTDLAKYLGINSQTVSHWIAGRSYPNYEKLESIARYFRLSVPELLSDSPPQEEIPSPSLTFIFCSIGSGGISPDTFRMIAAKRS